MGFSISDVSLKRTTKCPSNFLCLTNDKNPMCSKDRPICSVEIPLESMIFVEDMNNCYAYNNCVYKEKYGAAHICTCPVRFEIYSRYNM
jgi:hypothetical protein